MAKLSKTKVKKIFTGYLKHGGYAQKTVDGHLLFMRIFFTFLPDRIDLRDVGEPELLGFAEFLGEKNYSQSSKVQAVGTVRLMFKVLYQHSLVLKNPAADFTVYKKGDGNIKVTLTQDEMGRFLNGISIHGYLGLRDRCLFELLYATGMRGSEASNVNVGDIDLEHRTAFIRHGKNKKDRIVPPTVTVCKFLDLYISEKWKIDRPLFKGQGGRLLEMGMNRRFKKRVKECGLYRDGLTLHSIRHSTATHLLEAGAGLRYVQELLGHESVETVAIYTNQLHDRLKRIYRSYHPRENEYYREIDQSYLDGIDQFEKQLLFHKKKREGRRKS